VYEHPVRREPYRCSVSDPVNLVLCELPQSFYLFSYSYLNTKVFTFKLIGGHYFNVHYILIVTLLSSAIDVGFQAMGVYGSEICNS
jgi:hypothetical protein